MHFIKQKIGGQEKYTIPIWDHFDNFISAF